MAGGCARLVLLATLVVSARGMPARQCSHSIALYGVPRFESAKNAPRASPCSVALLIGVPRSFGRAAEDDSGLSGVAVALAICIIPAAYFAAVGLKKRYCLPKRRVAPMPGGGAEAAENNVRSDTKTRVRRADSRVCPTGAHQADRARAARSPWQRGVRPRLPRRLPRSARCAAGTPRTPSSTHPRAALDTPLQSPKRQMMEKGEPKRGRRGATNQQQQADVEKLMESFLWAPAAPAHALVRRSRSTNADKCGIHPLCSSWVTPCRTIVRWGAAAVSVGRRAARRRKGLDGDRVRLERQPLRAPGLHAALRCAVDRCGTTTSDLRGRARSRAASSPGRSAWWWRSR